MIKKSRATAKRTKKRKEDFEERSVSVGWGVGGCMLCVRPWAQLSVLSVLIVLLCYHE